MEAYLQGQSSGYSKLNEKAQAAIQSFIQNVDSSFFEKFETDVDMELWIKTNVINPLKKNIDDSDLAIRIQTLFSINEKDYKSYQAYINAVLDIINALANLTDKSGKKIYTKPIVIMKRWLTRAAKTTNLHVDLLIPEQKKES